MLVLRSAQPAAGRVCIGCSEGPAAPIFLLRHDVHLPDDGEVEVRCRIERLPLPAGPVLPVGRRVPRPRRAARLAAGGVVRRGRPRPRRRPARHRPPVAGPRRRPLGRRHAVRCAVHRRTGPRCCSSACPPASAVRPGRWRPSCRPSAASPTGSSPARRRDGSSSWSRTRAAPSGTCRSCPSAGASGRCAGRGRRCGSPRSPSGTAGELAAIHANGLKELSLSLPAAFVSRVPLVVWVHNFALPPSVRWFGWLWRLVLPRCDVRWAAVSPLARDLAVDAGLATADEVEIVPNPIDPDDVVAPEHLGGDPVTVAYLGAPRQYKGFDLLPDIIAELGDRVPVRWLVFSRQTDDDLDATWQRLRAMAGNGRRVDRGQVPRRARRCTPVVTSSCARRCSTRSAGWRPRRCSTASPSSAATCRRSATCSATTRPGCSSRSATPTAAATAVGRLVRTTRCGPASARPAAPGGGLRPGDRAPAAPRPLRDHVRADA